MSRKLILSFLILAGCTSGRQISSVGPPIPWKPGNNFASLIDRLSEKSGQELDLLENFSVYIERNGPNCHNTVLNSAGVLRSIRYVDEHEFYFWLNSPLCRLISDEETLPESFLRVIKSRRKFASKDQLVHSQFVFNGGLRQFEKVGASGSSPYVSQPTKIVGRSTKDGGYLWKKVVRRPECSRAESQPKDCWVWAELYECESFESYSDRILPHLSSDQRSCLKELSYSVSAIENRVEAYLNAKANGSPRSSQNSDFANLNNEIYELIDDLKSAGWKEEMALFFSKALLTRMEGLEFQLNTSTSDDYRTNDVRGLVY